MRFGVQIHVARAGSHWDAHTHIGQGTIGVAGFRALVNEPRLQPLPVILETPVDQPDADEENLGAIRSLVRNPRSTKPKLRNADRVESTDP